MIFIHMERFPSLMGQSAQLLALKRNCIISDDLKTLFNTIQTGRRAETRPHTFIQHGQTAFQKQLASKKAIAVHGPSNVWTTEPTANFHLRAIACANAAGFVKPPAFIQPGKTVSSQLLSNCRIPGAAVTTSPSGCMNIGLFKKWLHFFSRSVPTGLLLLIPDGCGSHYSAEVIDATDALAILLVILTPNGTHL